MNKSQPLILQYFQFTEAHHQYLTNVNTIFKLSCKTCLRSIGASIKITSNWMSMSNIRVKCLLKR